MLQWLKAKFGTARVPVQVLPPVYAPGTRIGFDPALIARFHTQHGRLLDVFSEIAAHARAQRYEALMAAIDVFRRDLSEHLLEENVRLYTYLAHCLQHDPGSESLARAMHSEMARIGREVTGFIRLYTQTGVSDANRDVFLAELMDIGAALQDRIQREEATLYPLYLAPGDYGSAPAGYAERA